MYSGTPKNFLKKLYKYIVSQVQIRKDNAIACKKAFEHNNDIIFRATSETVLLSKWLKMILTDFQSI